MNEININSGAFWEGLGYEERRIAVQAIAEWQEKEAQKKIDTLKKEILTKIAEFYKLADWQEMNALMTELNYIYN